MKVKRLLKEALEAKIQGNDEAFNAAMKKAVLEKTKRLVKENGAMGDTPDETGFGIGVPLMLRDVEVSIDGELQSVDVVVQVNEFEPASQGSYSWNADSDSDYHGSSAELDFTILEIHPFDEDGNPLAPIVGEEAKSLVDNAAYSRIYSTLIDRAEQPEDDDWY